MLFVKTAPVVSRSTFAAQTTSKKFWASSNQNQSGPSFFVSTPQFNRHQQNQVAFYLEDGRGAGNSGSGSDSNGIDNPYLPLTAGANSAAAAPVGLIDDDGKEELAPAAATHVYPKRYLNLNPKLVSLENTRLVSRSAAEPSSEITSSGIIQSFNEDIRKDPLGVIIDRTGPSDLINGMVQKMQRLHATGSHREVLDTFENLEVYQFKLPIEAYNIALSSLAALGDANLLLEGYERFLACGAVPNEKTCSIVVNALMEVSVSLAMKRHRLRPLIGNGVDRLESVSEIREGLPVEEYIMLALTIIEPVVMSHPKPLDHDLQQALDGLVAFSVEHGIMVPENLIRLSRPSLDLAIALEPSIKDAAAKFSASSPENQQCEVAQSALISSYIKYQEPAGAIAFFAGCGAPQYLLSPLLTGLASLGLVGLAGKWLTRFSPSARLLAEILSAIPLKEAKSTLASSTRIFYQLVGTSTTSFGTNNSGSDGNNKPPSDSPNLNSDLSLENSGRCSFIRLCIAAGDSDALLMAIRESKFSGVIWDATTLSDVISFLAGNSQPLLAADICAWQIPLLSNYCAQLKVRSFVEEEIISDTVRLLQNSDQLSLNTALRLLPVVLVCSQARQQVLDIIVAAKLGAPHELAGLVNSNNIVDIVRTLTSIMTNTTLKGTYEELSSISRIFPSLVEDSLSLRAVFTRTEVNDVYEALKQCKDSEVLMNLWLKRHSKATTPAGLAFDSARCMELTSNIVRYAKAPNGFDYALSLLKDQRRLKMPVSDLAVESLSHACVQTKNMSALLDIYQLVPRTPDSMNAIIRAAAAINGTELALEGYKTLKNYTQTFPRLPTYNALISMPSMSYQEGWKLFVEARDTANIPLDAQIYNTMATVLARALQKSELMGLMAEMHNMHFSMTPETYSNIISMCIKLNEGNQALSILKSAPTLTKSMLDVKVFNQLMSFFVKSSNRDAALEVFMELRNTGTLAIPTTYRLLMGAYLIKNKSNEPNLNNADKVLSLMRRDGSPITPQCFATLLHARGVLFKDLEGAINFYRGMVKNSRVLPDKSVFDALVESYVTNGKEKDLSAVLSEMKRYHVAADSTTLKLAGAANPSL